MLKNLKKMVKFSNTTWPPLSSHCAMYSQHYGLQKEQGWTKFPIDDFYSKKLSCEFAWRISKNLNIWLVASQAFSSWRFWPNFPILEPYRDCINHNFALERDTDLNLVSILMFLGMRNHLGWVSDTSDWHEWP